MPVKEPQKLGTSNELKSEYFLARREMGVINIGGNGKIIVDGVSYNMNKYDCLYIGKGSKDITFISDDENNPAKFYLNCCPAHKEYPTSHAPLSKATPKHLGSKATCNERTIYKYIYPEGIKSCQLVMGCTMLEEGSVWNTMPTHTHDRRMEVYLYFDLGDDIVFHLMGKGDETRHIVMHNEESVISPSWSIHSGCGTKNYTFIWGMCGENQDFDDMDHIAIKDMK
jgi:4-deoxy-L-threo-5-hexosulose-uronate ketol-isomerase